MGCCRVGCPRGHPLARARMPHALCPFFLRCHVLRKGERRAAPRALAFRHARRTVHAPIHALSARGKALDCARRWA